MSGKLFYGDNLEVLRRYVGSESVDLVYLDPPFNSNATYNVLFAERDGARSTAQIKAFGDTWQWDREAAAAYEEVVEQGGDLSRAMQAFRTVLSHSNMLAYLAMMAPRLRELHRVLKQTGSLYLHCDPTASHYLKLLLDSVFGAPKLSLRDHLEAQQCTQRHETGSPDSRSHPRCNPLLYQGRRMDLESSLHSVRRGLYRVEISPR